MPHDRSVVAEVPVVSPRTRSARKVDCSAAVTQVDLAGGLGLDHKIHVGDAAAGGRTVTRPTM